MRIVRRYIALEVARTGAIVLLVMTCAFVLERTLRLLRDVDPAQLPLGTAAAMLGWKLPEILAIALPLALFAGVLLTFQRLARDHELDVIRGMGAGLWSTARPLALITAATAVLFVVTLWFLLPHGRYQYSALAQRAAHDLLAAPLRTGSFIQLGDSVLYVQPRTDGSGKPATIFLYEAGGDGPAQVTTAAIEDFTVSADGRRLFVSLLAGRRTTVPDGSGGSTLLSFERAREMVHVDGRETLDPRGADAAELTFPELLAASGDRRAPAAAARIEAQVHAKLARALLLLLLPLAAVSLALAFPVGLHGFGIAAGVVLVVGIDQALIFGEALVALGEASPPTAIWAPLALFAALSAGGLAAAGRRRR